MTALARATAPLYPQVDRDLLLTGVILHDIGKIYELNYERGFSYSDEGQLLFLKGFTHPARYLDLAKRKKIPANLAKRLPPASSYQHVKFATLAQITAASQIVADEWGPKVLGS